MKNKQWQKLEIYRCTEKFPIGSLKHLIQNVTSTEKAIEFLRCQGLLASKIFCSKRNIAIKTRKCERVVDKVISYCPKCKTTSSICQGSFFSRTKMQLGDVLILTHLWCTGMPSFITKRQVPEISEKDNQWLVFLSKGYLHPALWKYPVKFGKGNVDVELQIGESLFGKKQKYHKEKSFQRD